MTLSFTTPRRFYPGALSSLLEGPTALFYSPSKALGKVVGYNPSYAGQAAWGLFWGVTGAITSTISVAPYWSWYDHASINSVERSNRTRQIYLKF